MRPDLVSILAGDCSIAARQLRELPDVELDECPPDFLERGARHLRAASYSCLTAARRFEARARQRRNPT